MSDPQLSSDSLLVRLRKRLDRGGTVETLHRDQVLALVECAEALKDMRSHFCGLPKSCGHDFTCICAGQRMDAAIARLEAL